MAGAARGLSDADAKAVCAEPDPSTKVRKKKSNTFYLALEEYALQMLNPL